MVLESLDIEKLVLGCSYVGSVVYANYVMPYVKSPGPWQVMNSSLADFERKYIGLRIYKRKDRLTFMYNNYTHFGNNFNDMLLTDVAHAASAAGIWQFEVDGGWYTTAGNIGKQVNWMSNIGDWIAHKVKFPHGPMPVFSVDSAAPTSKVFQDHPEWPRLDEQGKPADLHGTEGAGLNTMCFGTLWKNYIKGKILTLVKALGLKYVNLDLTVLTSAYVMDTRSGDVMLPAILIIKVSVCKRM
jgi:hypothetical protein